MPEVEFQAGTFCWVDNTSNDPGKAKEFYSGLFGWDLEDFPIDDKQTYTMARLSGRDVGAISPAQDQSAPPSWNTYIGVTSADETAEKVRSAGGTVLMDPFDVFDQGRMFGAQDPTGAYFFLWEPKATSGWGIVNEPGTVIWNELATRGKDKAALFYQDAFGWGAGENPYAAPDDPQGIDYTVFAIGEAPIGGAMEIGEDWPADIQPHWVVYFSVDDTDATVSKAVELGGQVVTPPMETPAGRMAQIADPNGAQFSIIKMAPPPDA